MLAFQEILEDEKGIGPDFIAFASSTNAEVTREIRDTECLISRLDMERENRIKAHKAAINKIWWVPYHRRPDHPTPYHRNSPLPTSDPDPNTACLFTAHHQAHRNLPDTLVCCDGSMTQEKLLQLSRPHLGGSQAGHHPHTTRDS